MRKPTLIEAVQALTTQGFGWDGGTDEIVWPETNTGDAPTRLEIDAKLVELEKEFSDNEYARNRARAYDSVGDQLDDLYHAGVFSAEMTAKLKKVKDDNPK